MTYKFPKKNNIFTTYQKHSSMNVSIFLTNMNPLNGIFKQKISYTMENRA